jgi:hypothetical protein
VTHRSTSLQHPSLAFSLCYFLLAFIGIPQQMRSQVSTQPQAVSTLTTIPQTPQASFAPSFSPLAFDCTGFAATLAGAALGAAFFGAVIFPAFGSAAFFTAFFGAAFFGVAFFGALFVAINKPPFQNIFERLFLLYENRIICQEKFLPYSGKWNI